MNIYENISQIENYLSMLLTHYHVSDEISVGQLPAALDKGTDDMVLIDVARSTEYDSHGTATANIYLYARPVNSALRKNVVRLNQMENKLNTAVADRAFSPHYGCVVQFRDSGYDDNRNFHYNMMNVKIVIT